MDDLSEKRELWKRDLKYDILDLIENSDESIDDVRQILEDIAEDLKEGKESTIDLEEPVYKQEFRQQVEGLIGSKVLSQGHKMNCEEVVELLREIAEKLSSD